MANVSDWSANELENLFLDDMNLSDERGRRAAKIMAAVKAKEDEQDAKLEAVAGGLVFRGTKATYAELEAVEDPAVGDMYSVTELGGENYAWDGEAWDALGTSDANVVHKTGDEEIAGDKKFLNSTVTLKNNGVEREHVPSKQRYYNIYYGDKNNDLFALCRYRYNTSGNIAFLNTIMQYGGEEVATGDLTWFSFFDNSKEATGAFSLLPATTNLYALGRADLLWSEVFSATASINTSDERAKEEIDSISDEILDVWGSLNWRQFKLSEAVEKKGDNARIHAGMVAQQIQEEFQKAGLDVSRYAFFCHDAWESKPADVDDEGRIISPAVEAGDAYAMRYTEALCIEAAYQRRRADRLEERIAALEARLNGSD